MPIKALRRVEKIFGYAIVVSLLIRFEGDVSQKGAAGKR
jgi:hypothetical protein